MTSQQLPINRLIQWHDGEEPPVERILHIDPKTKIVVTFDIRLKDTKGNRIKGLEPVPRTVDEIEAALRTGHAHLLDADKDPYRALTQVDEKDIPPEYRERRDAAWAILAPLVLDDNGLTRVAFFDPSERHRLILSVAKQAVAGGNAAPLNNEDTLQSAPEDDSAGAAPSARRQRGRNADAGQSLKHAKKVLYDWIRKWWRGGMVPNALLPYWKQCGPKNGQRKVRKKLGRPSNRSRSYDQVLGVNVDAHTQDLLIQGYRRFYDVKQQYRWKHAYQRTMELFFNCGTEQLPSGALSPILLPIDERPTPEQFKYYAKRALNADYVRELKRLFGLSTFNLELRAILGNSTQMAMGPMMVYEVDAWLADLYLVSALNRAWIIGKPVVYSIKDVFSRLIVGFGVGLEGPSWAGARLALVNIVEDKVALCKRYGIDISPEMWPNADLSQRILADRGEFEGYDASTLQNAFGVGIGNVGAYRGDLKAIVERDFLLLKNETVSFIPGFTNYKVRERGQKDYRLDACLTVYEFCQTLIRHIIFHNNVWRMQDYRLDTYAIQDDVPAIPIRLWNWGIEHRTGWRREAPSPERVRLALLPRATASITERGLLFKGLHYTITFPSDDEGCQAEELFVRARAEGWERVEVAFDHGKPQLIYLCLENGQRLIPCPLLPSEASFYERDDLDLYEIEDYFARRENGNVEHRAVAEQEIAKIHAENELLFKRAQADAKAAQEGLTKTALLGDIKGNRRREKEVDAQPGVPQVDDKTSGLSPAPEQPGSNHPDGYVAPASSIDILNSLLGDGEVDG